MRPAPFWTYTARRKIPHDTQVGYQLLARNLDRLSTLTADKGYDSAEIRHVLLAHRVTPVIKYREFRPLQIAHNRLLDSEVYHQRSAVETTFRVLKQRFGDRLTARIWYGQYRELVLRCAIKNIEDHTKTMSA